MRAIAAGEKKSATVQKRYVRKDGQLVWGEVNMGLIRDNNNQPIYFLTIVKDITERKRAENMLRESDENLRVAQRVAKIGSWKWTEATDSVYWSEELCRLNGYDSQLPAPGFKEMSLFYTPESRKRLNEAVAKSLKTGEPYELELDFIRKDGVIRNRFVRGEVDYDTDGRVVGLHGIAQDITELKKAENALKASEERFRKAFYTSPDAININRLDDGVYVSINNGFTEISGYTERDCLGRSSLELNIWVDPKDRETLVAGLRKNGFVKNLEAPFRAKNGDIICGLMSASIIDLDGVPNIISVTRDITERKQAEMKLDARKKFIKSIVNMTPDILYIYDLVEKKNVYSNDGIQKVLGYTPEDLKEMDDHVIQLLMHPDDYQKYENEIIPKYAVLKDHESVIHQFRMKHRSGQWRWLSTNEIVYLRRPDGSPWQIFGIIHDVTDARLAEEIINRDKETLAAMVRERTQELVNVQSELEQTKRL